MNRTGSSASRVGPAVTSRCSPAMSFWQARWRWMCSSSCWGSGILPGPTAPQASRPQAGSITSTPYPRRRARLAWVAGFSYMPVFMAGATSLGHRQASTVVVSISSAMPFAILAITLALAGATSTRSARSATATCSISKEKLRSKVSTMQRVPVSASKVSGAIKRVAFSVISTSTVAFCFTSILARVAILYAAMPPVRASTTVLPFRSMDIPPCCAYCITSGRVCPANIRLCTLRISVV